MICKLPMNHVCKSVWYGANLLARSGYTDAALCSRGVQPCPAASVEV